MVTARELAAWDDGISSVVGDSELEISCVAGFDRAAPGVLTFVKAETIADAPDDVAARIAGAAVVCKASLADGLAERGDVALLIAEHPRLSFMKLVTQFFPPERPAAGVHETAVIYPGATIDPEASIGPYCVVGPGCAVGAGSILHAGVVLQADVRIGRNVAIHASTVIGADGFGYERRPDGKLEKFPHLGGVVIEDEVEIGSNTSIDCGSLGDTVLRRGCKIDNQVHIAHNVDVGEDAVVIAQAMIGGSVRIGARAWVAPAGIILNQVVIGEGALVGLGAVVTKDVAAGQTVLGSPAVPEDQFKANRAALKRLLEGGIT